MLRIISGLLLLLQFPVVAQAAGIGDRCQLGANVAPTYLCPIGTLCLKSISNLYCSSLDRQCGWNGTSGYYLGQKKTYQGDEYVCTTQGFVKSTSASTGTPSAVVSIPGVTNIPVTPMVRTLNGSEETLLRSIYGTSINYSMVRITNTEGAADGAPWTTNTPPLYTVNVGVNCFVSFTRDDCRNGDGLGLLVHEMGHVWQGQHGIPFMSNSLFHQGQAVLSRGDRNRAYDFSPGGQWRSYNAEQQAEIVEAWYRDGRSTASALYPYLRDNVRPGQPNATTRFR